MLVATADAPEDSTPTGSDAMTRGVAKGALTGGGQGTEFWMVVMRDNVQMRLYTSFYVVDNGVMGCTWDAFCARR